MNTDSSEKIKISNLTFFALVKIFLENRKIIILTSLVFGVITAILVFFVIKPIFLSQGTVKSFSSSTGLAGLIGESIPDIGAIGDLAGGGAAAKDLALYQSIILSRRLDEEAIIKFNLNEEWDFKYMPIGPRGSGYESKLHSAEFEFKLMWLLYKKHK